MGLVRVTVREGARGNHVGQRGVIHHFDHGSTNEGLRERHVDAKDVPELVKKGLIDQPSDAQMNGGEGADDKGTADALAGKVAANAGEGHGDVTVGGTTALINFEPGHPSRQDEPGLPGSKPAGDAEKAADELDPDDPDAAPKPAGRRVGKKDD